MLKIEQDDKFKIYAVALFFFLGLVTILEIFNKHIFAELFLRMSSNISWILGLTVGMVVPDILLRIRSHTIGKHITKRFFPETDERFLLFLANAAILTFIVSLARGIVVVFLTDYYEYFHLIIIQWFVLVYLWFKFINGFKTEWKYVLATEITLIIFTIVLLLSLE